MSDNRNPTPIEAGLTSALGACLGFDRIEPDAVDMPDDPDQTALPAVAYRQIGGDRSAYLDSPSGGLHEGLFLVEFFARTREECSGARDRLTRTFAGPCPDDPAAGPPPEGAEWNPVKWPGGVWVYSIAADDPTADADFGVTDAHLYFRFCQLIFRISYVLIPEPGED